MSEHEIPPDGAARHRAVRQMQAWFRRVDPVGHRVLNSVLLDADLSGDDRGYELYEDAALGAWRANRDNPLSPERQRSAELGQAVAWLGDRLSLTWIRAHGIRLDHAEQDRDNDRLIGFWREDRDAPEFPDQVTRYVDSLSHVREARLAKASAWHREHDPAGHANWYRRRSFADTIGDACADDREVLRDWAEHHPEPGPGSPHRAGVSVTENRRTESVGARPKPDATRFGEAGLGEDQPPARSL